VPESDCLAHKVLPALHRHVEISRVDFDDLIPYQRRQCRSWAYRLPAWL
jgi:hypothetical protein